LATAATMLIIYACNRVVPFGDKTVLRMDLYHQYGPLFAELYERVMQGASLTYSWISGLGSCFLGNYFNYLSSPVGAVIMFFGHNNIPEAIGAMVLIKAALSSATFTYYIKRSLKSQSYATVAFGVMYSFCAYMLAYYWNVMWLDAMVLLPVVLLGIERIINNGKPATYLTALALTMFSNYYMSYMLCIFSVVYFMHYYITNYTFSAKVNSSSKVKGLKNNRFFRSGCIFAFSSLAAAGLMACVLLPVYGVLQSSSATSGTFPKDPESYFNFFDFFANHFAALTTTIRSSGDDVLPNIYCGVLTIILAPLFFFTKSISKKEKVTTLSLLAVLYFTFNLNFLNYIWHGFHFPNDLPYRQSFIYSFILLVMAYKTFIRLNEFKARHFGVVGGALVAFVVLVDELTSKNVTDGTVLLTLALIVLYVLVLTIFKDKKYQTVSVAALLIVCICSEAVMCDTSSINISVDKTPYASDLEDFEKIKDTLDTIEKDSFYRMELTDLRTRMDPSWYYYNGVSVFSSMASEKVSNLQDDLGMMSNRINSYTYNPQTPVYNMMFALKYLVNNESPNVLSSKYYENVAGNNTFTAYKNKYNLPIAFMTGNEVKDWASEDYIETWKFETGSDPFELQGDWFSRATGLDNPFERMEVTYVTYSNVDPFTESLEASSFYFNKTTPDTDASSTFYLTTEKEGNVYIYFDITGSNSKSITVNSSIGTATHPADQDCVLDLGR
ncbi:MAG: YfhO family protein, partial [Clostridia bacterium]|nr:YfhO family protein [Clostridia bacterium]